jgi:hypothetical protein
VIGTFLNELRFSTRTLARRPVWTALLIVTIAFGIASNASVDGFARGLAVHGEPDADGRVTPELVEGIARIGQLLRMAAIAVFVIACANVASFLLSRASARSRETAVRVAIGAGRAQLVRQVMADSVVISILGAAAGAIVTFWIARVLPAMLFDQDADQMVFAANPAGVWLIAGASAIVTVVCGLLPLIEMRHDDPGAIMQRENSGPSRASIRLGSGLVILQMTACTLLVISAGLLVAGFRTALQTTAGRRLEAPIVVSIESLQTSSKAVQESSGLAYFDASATAVREITGATSITWAAAVPGNRPSLQTFEFETPNMPVRALSFVSTPFTRGTLNTLIMPPIAGRLFGTIDAGPCGGVVITREAARAIGAEPIIGRSIETPAGEWAEIVGVVAAREDETPRVYHYMPLAEEPYPSAVTSTYRALQPGGSRQTTLDVNIVARNFFEFMGLPLVAGRAFATTPTACRVAIVNEQAADRFFGGEAVGGAIIDRLGRRTSIIGVVGSNQLRAAQRPVQPTVYFPMGQDFLFRMSLIAETGGVSDATLRQLHRRIELIPGGRQDRIIVKTLDDHLSRTAFAPERIASVLVGASATIAIVLGMLGLYGTMSDVARRRQREFAVRIALGARGGHVVGQVVAEALRLVLAGTLCGTLGSLVVARSISSIAPVSGMPSPWIWLAAPLTLALAVAIAGVLPARRATSANPLAIMRGDS